MMYADMYEWTQQSVQNCLDDYSELFAVCQTPSVCSSWSQGAALRAIPGRISPRLDLVATKLALESALSDLSRRHRRVFRLRYSAELTQREIGKCLGCSRQQVFYMLRQISQALFKTLSSP
jgi:RNA polymerase sigma factor (sigma-70 family)